MFLSYKMEMLGSHPWECPTKSQAPWLIDPRLIQTPQLFFSM
jgi:hypothetical protein